MTLDDDDQLAAEIQQVIAGHLSREQVAKRYGVSLRTISAWQMVGRIPKAVALPLGGKPRKWWRVATLVRFERKRYGATVPELSQSFANTEANRSFGDVSAGHDTHRARARVARDVP